MAPAVDHRPETRPILVLHARETFSDDLGGFGEAVRPRHAGMRFRGEEEEAFCLRRLLVAWKTVGLLEFPVEVHRRGPGDGHPDFDLHVGPSRRLLGVEHTNAGAPEYQRHLTLTSGPPEDDGSDVTFAGDADGWTGDSVERTLVADLRSAIDRKRRTLRQGAYRNAPDCDLLVYELSKAGIVAPDYEKVVALLREAEQATIGQVNSTPAFRQVHLVFGDTVVADALGRSPRFVDLSTDYDIDYVGWTRDQARKAREEGAQALDLGHVAEEIESLGRSDKRARDSHLANLVMHLLKWHYQPERRGRSWFATIRNCRRQLDKLLAESPSLDPLRLPSDKQNTLLEDAYDAAFPKAVDETGLPESVFPEVCPYTFDQVLDPDFLPGPVRDEDSQP